MRTAASKAAIGCCPFVALLACAVIAPAAVQAQGAVRGVVYDSLRLRGPVPNAVVTVAGTAIQTRADARGRFELDNVPVGQQVIRHHAPWLDSLSLPPLAATVTVQDGRTARVSLSTPTASAYQRAVCGAEFPEPLGVMRGEVRGPDGNPRAGVFVGAVWSQAVVTRAGLSGELIGSVDTTDANGFYSLCGVPRETLFQLRAGNDTVGTGLLAVTLGSSIIGRRDLVVGDDRRRATLGGRVVNARGTPMANAVVTSPNDSTQSVRTDAEGRFSLRDVPQRSAEIIVRTIGFIPQYIIIQPTESNVEIGDIVMDVVAQDIDTVRVYAARTASDLEFLERRRRGLGVSLDSAELARFPRVSANVLSTYGRGVRTSGGSQPRIRLRAPSGGIGATCGPMFYVDGLRWGRPVDGFEEAAVLESAKKIEIFQNLETPINYPDPNGCGVVLIWTQ